MIDLGQYLSAQDRRDSASRLPFAGQSERAARNAMIERDCPIAERRWRRLRALRLAGRGAA